MLIDQTDKKLLRLLQDKFPLVARPFRHIATSLAIEETEVIERTLKLKDAGIIRRIGPLFNPQKLGFKTTLFALKANDSNEDRVVSYLNTLPNITHNYKRDNEYNIWFTFAYKNDDELNSLKERLKCEFNIEDILELPSIKTYKLKTRFYAD